MNSEHLKRLSTSSASLILDDFRISAARKKLVSFVKYTKYNYVVKWYHEKVCECLDNFLFNPGENRLMVFMPPQHGKSEIVSRRMPAFALGNNPDLQIVNCSHTFKLASKMNRDVQRIIDGPKYDELFPNIGIRSLGLRTSTGQPVVRRQDEFEIVGHEGRYMSVGIMGGLTGNPVDILVIDDPIKDPQQAFSKLMRERVWDWYMAVADTRLHRNSKILLTMTRWHEDDLAGRLLKLMKEGEGEKWKVIKFPAIKENDEDPDDIRLIGEGLWPEKHDPEKLKKIEKNSKRIYISLYQQRPSAEEGEIFRKAWFRKFRMADIEAREIETKTKAIWNFVGDTAYEEKKKDDPSAFLAYTFINNSLYIREVAQVYYEMPELIEFAKEFAARNENSRMSKFKIEPKASGKSLIQMLKKTTKLNISEGEIPTKDKVLRANICVPFVESGRVYLLEGASWVDNFLEEVIMFPNATHDDRVDCLTMAISEVSGGIKGVQQWYDPSQFQRLSSRI